MERVCFTASRSEKMEGLSTEGNNWQVLKVPGRWAGGGSSTLAGQKMDEKRKETHKK